MSDHQVLDHVDQYLSLGREYDCSDIHLTVDYPPAWRRFGQLGPIWHDHPVLSPEETERLARGFLGEKEWKRLQEKGDVDFAYYNDHGRYRASVIKQRLGYEMVFRVINTKIRTLQEIGLPLEHLVPLTRYQNGLILVTGAVGSGKSTTLAAFVDFINKDREDHILTLEDPIEYVFESQGDLETLQLALTAAETGHLVLGTLHTGNAPRTLDRVLDVFPTDQRDQIRIMVSESLRGIVSQQLVPRADGQGRVLALELLVNTAAVANCIREGKTFMLPGIMQTGKNVGMITMDESLRKLYVQGIISADDALFRAEDKAQMRAFFQS
jgi:twitching motility protein PilT